MQLADDHTKLRRIMRDFSVMMDAAHPDMIAISQMRIAFSRLFREHLQREDALSRGLLSAAAQPEAQEAARTHLNAMRELFLEYNSHIKHWTPEEMKANWPGYRKATSRLRDILFRRMDWEERVLHRFASTH